VGGVERLQMELLDRPGACASFCLQTDANGYWLLTPSRPGCSWDQCRWFGYGWGDFGVELNVLAAVVCVLAAAAGVAFGKIVHAARGQRT
jgi:hypothetical protein